MSFIKKLQSKDKSVHNWGISYKKYQSILSKYPEEKSSDFIPLELIIEILKNKDLYNDCYTKLASFSSSFTFQIIRSKEDTIYNYNIDKCDLIKYLKIYYMQRKIPNKYIPNLKQMVATSTYEYFIEHAPSNREMHMLLYMTKSKEEFISYLDRIYSHKPSELKDVYNKLLQDPYGIDIFEKDKYSVKYPIYIAYNFPKEFSQNISDNCDTLKQYLKLPKMVIIYDNYTLQDLIIDLHNNPDSIANKTKIANILSKLKYTIRDTDDMKLVNFFVLNNVSDGYVENFKENKARPDNISLNEDLKKQLLSELPPEFTKLQKAYYIYRRLCQILTYDEEYFAGAQTKLYKIRHDDPSKLKDIDFQNNEVICSTAMRIFDEFLEILGVEYCVLDGSDKLVDKYYSGHQYTQFKIDDFVVNADMTTGIIQGDLPLEKIVNKVEDFTIKTNIANTRIKYCDEIKVVDEYLNKNKEQIEFNDAIWAYNQSANKDILTYEERKDILLSTFGNTPLAPVDEIIYMINGKRQLFPDSMKNCCLLNYVAYDKPEKLDKEICLACVVTFNPDNVDNIETNEYYLVIRNNACKYTIDQIQALFDQDKLKLFSKAEKNIPGIRVPLKVEYNDLEGKNNNGDTKSNSKRNKH